MTIYDLNKTPAVALTDVGRQCPPPGSLGVANASTWAILLLALTKRRLQSFHQFPSETSEPITFSQT